MLKICNKGHITGYRHCGTCGTEDVGNVAVRVVISAAEQEHRNALDLAHRTLQAVYGPPKRSRGPYASFDRRKTRRRQVRGR